MILLYVLVRMGACMSGEGNGGPDDGGDRPSSRGRSGRRGHSQNVQPSKPCLMLDQVSLWSSVILYDSPMAHDKISHNTIG